jgi:two-component system phosphate regulon sensor histidine kinase PhoR
MNVPVRWKPTAIAILVAACCLFVAGIAVVQLLDRQRLLQRQTILEHTIAMVESPLFPLLVPSNDSPHHAELQASIRALGARTSARVTLIAPNGTVLADSAVQGGGLASISNQGSAPEVRQALSARQGQDERIDEINGVRTLYRAILIATGNGSGPVVLRVGMATAQVDRDFDRLKLIIVLSLGTVFLAVLSSTIWFTRAQLRPLVKIVRATRQLASGIFAPPLHTLQENDITNIANWLDQTARQVQAKIAELSEDRAQLLAVLTSMVEGVLVLDRRGYVLQINPALERIFGISRPEARGRPFAELFRNQQLNELIETTLLSRTHRKVELTLPLTGRCLQIEASFAGGERDNEACVVLVCHDITELRHLETIRKDFVANVSHELRTPLTSIKGYVEALLDGAKDDPAMLSNFLDIILKQSDRLNRIIADLLELSRIESGQVLFRQEPIDLRMVLDRAVSTIKPLAEKKDHRLVVHLEEPLPSLVGDEDRLGQIMTNLLDNAVKYTPPAGTITVTAKRTTRSRPDGSHEEAIELSVADTGIGIPPEDRPRVFERFYRVDKARSRELGGTGLGLAIVKHLVEGHSGEVWVEANKPKGSRFIVRLPAHRGYDRSPP